MKLSPKFKIAFLACLSLLYLSGLIFFIFDRLVRIQGELGQENDPRQFMFLHLHGILGLIFLSLFGYLYAKHIQPSLRKKKNIKSGLVLLFLLILLCLSVPGLYYFSNENLKTLLSGFHTYSGLILPIPLLGHLLKKSRG